MKTAYVVLGMHRSGTSSVAGALALLGATPPQTLMGPAADNPSGFWESEVLMAFNDEILARAGSSWDDWRPLDPAVFSGEEGAALRARAVQKLHEEFGDAETIVLKDPRICRFYDFWREALAEAGYRPLVISPVRAPAEVSASLAARNGMPIEDGLKLWERHVRDAEHASRGQVRHIFGLDDFLEDWRGEVERLAKALNVDLSPSVESAAQIDKLLNRNAEGARKKTADDSANMTDQHALFLSLTHPSRDDISPLAPTRSGNARMEMSPVEAYAALFPAMLGRELSEAEKDRVRERFGDAETVDLKAIGYEIALSAEFFNRYRETFAYRLFPTSTVVTSRGPLGHRLQTDLRQFHLGFAIASGHFEPHETAFVVKTIKKGMTVLDVGANIGYFSTIFAGLVGDSGKVIAFEPVTDTYHKLSAAISMNGLESMVELRKAAASETTGTCQISYNPDSVNMGGVSIALVGAETPYSIQETAATVRIDEVVGGRPVHFIKMDVEGAEGLALSGALETIRRNKPIMMIEFNAEQLANVSAMHPQALFDRIVALGYNASLIGAEGQLTPFDQTLLTRGGSWVLNLAFHPA